MEATAMCAVRRGHGGVRKDIRLRLTQTAVSGNITEHLLLQGCLECAVEESWHLFYLTEPNGGLNTFCYDQRVSANV